MSEQANKPISINPEKLKTELDAVGADKNPTQILMLCLQVWDALHLPVLGQNPALQDEPPLSIVQLDALPFTFNRPSEGQKLAAKSIVDAFNKYPDGKLVLPKSNLVVSVSGRYASHAANIGVKHRPYDAHFAAATVIDELLKNAVLGETYLDKKDGNDSLYIHRLYAPFMFKGELYRAKMTIQDSRVKNDVWVRFYDNALVNVDIEQIQKSSTDGLTPRTGEGSPNHLVDSRASTISIADLMTGAMRDGDGLPFSVEKPNDSIKSEVSDSDRVVAVIQKLQTLGSYKRIHQAYESLYGEPPSDAFVASLKNRIIYDNSLKKNKTLMDSVANDLPAHSLHPAVTVKDIKKSVDIDDLDKVYKAVEPFTADKDIRYYLQGIHTTKEGDVIATNGHFAVIVKANASKNRGLVYMPRPDSHGTPRWQQGGVLDESTQFPDLNRILNNAKGNSDSSVQVTINTHELVGITKAMLDAQKGWSDNLSSYAGFVALELSHSKRSTNKDYTVVDTRYLRTIIQLLASFGYKEAKAIFNLGSTAHVISSPDDKVVCVLMPMRANLDKGKFKPIDPQNLSRWIDESQANKVTEVIPDTTHPVLRLLTKSFVAQKSYGSPALTAIRFDGQFNYATDGYSAVKLSSPKLFDTPGIYPTEHTEDSAIKDGRLDDKSYRFPDVDRVMTGTVAKGPFDAQVEYPVKSLLKQIRAAKLSYAHGSQVEVVFGSDQSLILSPSYLKAGLDLMNELGHATVEIAKTQKSLVLFDLAHKDMVRIMGMNGKSEGKPYGTISLEQDQFDSLDADHDEDDFEQDGVLVSPYLDLFDSLDVGKMFELLDNAVHHPIATFGNCLQVWDSLFSPDEATSDTEGGDELSDDPNSPNYRYRDTGYIADSRKELAQSQIFTARSNGQMLRATDIDWDAIETNPRAAKELIIKSNLFGKINWDGLREQGMDAAAGFLIDRIYASIAPEPKTDGAFGRRDYALGLETIRTRLEVCKTVEQVLDVLAEIKDELFGEVMNADETAQYSALDQQATIAYGKLAEIRESNQQFQHRMNAASRELYDVKKQISSRERRGWKPDPDLQEQLVATTAAYEQTQQDWARVVKGNEQQRKDLETQIRDLGQQMSEVRIASRRRNILENPCSRAWISFGDKFLSLLKYRYSSGSSSFRSHVTNAKNGRITDWEWANKDRSITVKQATKAQVTFQLEVADELKRVGGREVKVESTQQLKEILGFREVQSGNWVLKDPDSARFHVEQTAAAMIDMGDVLGIEPNMLGLGGRLALAFGARGRGSAGSKSGGVARAHYEPMHRVINLTKMGGGGSLAHEWFHAIDDMLAELVKQESNGMGGFVSLTPHLLPEGKIRDAVHQLNTAIQMGTVRSDQSFNVTGKKSMAVRNVNNYAGYMGSIGYLIKNAGNAVDAVIAINAMIDKVDPKKRRKEHKRLTDWRDIAVAYYSPDDATVVRLQTGRQGSNFVHQSVRLDDGVMSKYWSAPHEMAARAFQSYIEDKLAEQGRQNDYLSVNANNAVYSAADFYPYPEGDERIAINAAFDQLFKAIRDEQVFENAAANEDLMDSMFGDTAKSIDDVENAFLQRGWESTDDGLEHESGRFNVQILENDAKDSFYIVIRVDGDYHAEIGNLKGKLLVNIFKQVTDAIGEDYFDSLLDDAAQQAATSNQNALPLPTEDQKLSGDYTKGEFDLIGMTIMIENPEGSVRSGTDANGETWEITMKHHYGYIENTVGADGDELDVFVKVGTEPDWTGTVYVIHQNDPMTGEFDEHKVVMGADSEADATAIYLSNYGDGWMGFDSIEAMDVEAFRDWVTFAEVANPTEDMFDNLGNGMPTFVETDRYFKKSDNLLEDEQVFMLTGMLSENPERGDLIRGGHGLRKIRLPRPGTGKSGGVRVIYYWATQHGKIILLDIYPKSEKDNLSRSELDELVRLAQEYM
jgi:mRNA-degrading endonuclease RelE of RelBE toxin-antitoxin system